MQVKDYVVYRTEGVCQISDEIYPDFVSDGKKKYFVLIPVENPSAKAYVPVDKAAQHCRVLVSQEEAEKLVESFEEIDRAEISNEKEREQVYRKVMEEGDLRKIIGILKDIRIRRKARVRSGKKTTAVDDKYYKIAERSLCRELGFVLKLTEEEVRERLCMAK